MDNFSINSSTSNEEFIFSGRDGEFFNFEVVSENLKATRKVSTYTDDLGIANLFNKVSGYTTAWEGSESWESLEGEFLITLTCNSTGHVKIQVKLNQRNKGSEDWHLTVHLNTEIGRLPQFANEVRRFFNA